MLGKKYLGSSVIAVDTQGLPYAIHITTANITDRGGALEMFSLHKNTLLNVEIVLVDGGYSGEPFANGVNWPLGLLGDLIAILHL